MNQPKPHLSKPEDRKVSIVVQVVDRADPTKVIVSCRPVPYPMSGDDACLKSFVDSYADSLEGGLITIRDALGGAQ